MSKTFAEYGLSSEEFEGLVLEDPALFDSFVIRMIEDLDLSAQVTAGNLGIAAIIEPGITERLFESLDLINGGDRGNLRAFTSEMLSSNSLDGFHSNIQYVVSAYVRGPVRYEPPSLDQIADVVTAIAFNALSAGGRQAREDGTQTVKLRHWLPACERWPYPFNRFC